MASSADNPSRAHAWCFRENRGKCPTFRSKRCLWPSGRCLHGPCLSVLVWGSRLDVSFHQEIFDDVKGMTEVTGYQQLKVRCGCPVGLPPRGRLSLLPPLPCPGGGWATLPTLCCLCLRTSPPSQGGCEGHSGWAVWPRTPGARVQTSGTWCKKLRYSDFGERTAVGQEWGWGSESNLVSAAWTLTALPSR